MFYFVTIKHGLFQKSLGILFSYFWAQNASVSLHTLPSQEESLDESLVKTDNYK